MSKGVRPNLIKQLNIRMKCDLNCKEQCDKLMIKQTDLLYKISSNIRTMLIINTLNIMFPIILISATSTASLVTNLLN